MLSSSLADAAAFSDSASLLGRYASNILAHPAEPKYRTIRASNPRFDAALGQHAAARAILKLVGFEHAIGAPTEPQRSGTQPHRGATTEPIYILPPSADLGPISKLVELIASAMPAQPAPAQPAPARPAALPTLLKRRRRRAAHPAAAEQPSSSASISPGPQRCPGRRWLASRRGRAPHAKSHRAAG